MLGLISRRTNLLALRPSAASCARRWPDSVSRDHFLKNPAEYVDAYVTFGRIAINWAGIEVTLEDMLIYLRIRTGTNRVNNFPGGFGQICDQIKERWPADVHFAARKDEMITVLAEATRLHEIRVAIVHGMCQGFSLDGRLEFGKSKRREGWAYRSQSFHLDDLNEAADRMLSLKDELEPLSGFVRSNWQRKADGTHYYWKREQDGPR